MFFLNRHDLPIIVKRLNAIPADAQPKWGRMGPAKMMRHLRHMVEMSMDEFEVVDQSNFVTRTVVRGLFFHVITRWPKNLKGPPEITPEPRDEFSVERFKLLDKLEAFVKLLEKEPQKKTLHPVFGWLTLQYWSRAHGVHFAHHLRQFGV